MRTRPGIKQIYRRLPSSLRHAAWFNSLKWHLLAHDEIYNDVYFEYLAESSGRSAPVIAASIVREFNPASVVDVGCGTGELLDALRTLGCEVYGLEYADAALKRYRARGLMVDRFDLESGVFQGGERFDVAVSMEVAEHLPSRMADRYVELLTRLAPTIVFSAAPPGQGGPDHVNEQPAEYWIEKFRRRSCIYDADLSEKWRSEWQAAGTVQWWYFQNVMVLRQE